MPRQVIVLALLATGACAPPEGLVLPDLGEGNEVKSYLLYSHAVAQEELFFTIIPFTPDDPPPEVFEASPNQPVYLKAMERPLAELPGLSAGLPKMVQVKEADFPRGPVLEGATFELTDKAFVEVDPSIATQPALPTLSAQACVDNGGCPEAALISGTAAGGTHWWCNLSCNEATAVALPEPPRTACTSFGWNLNDDEPDFVHCAPSLPDEPTVLCGPGQMMAFGDPNCRDVFYTLEPADVAGRISGPLHYVAPGASGTGTLIDPAGFGARRPLDGETWVLLPGRYTVADRLDANDFTLLGTHEGAQGATLVVQPPLRMSGNNVVLENLRLEHADGPTSNQRVLDLGLGTFTATAVEVLGSATFIGQLTVANSSIKAGDTRALVQKGGARELVVQDSELVASGGVWNASNAATTLRGVRITAPQQGRIGAQFSNHGDITFDRVLIAGDFKVGVTVIERDDGHAIDLNQVIVDLGTEQLADSQSRGISFADSSTTTQVGETIELTNISVRGAFIGIDISRGELLPLSNLLLQDNIKGITVLPENSAIQRLDIEGLWIDLQTRRDEQGDGYGLDVATNDQPEIALTDVVIRDLSEGRPFPATHSNSLMTNGGGDAHLKLTRARIHSGWRKGIVGFSNHELTDVVFDRCRGGITVVGPLTRESIIDFKLDRLQLIRSSMLVLGDNAEMTDLTIEGTGTLPADMAPAYDNLPQLCLRNDTTGFLRRFSFSQPSPSSGVIGFQEQRDPLPVGEFEFRDGAVELAPNGHLVSGGQCLFSTERLSDRAKITFANVNVTAAD